MPRCRRSIDESGGHSSVGSFRHNTNGPHCTRQNWKRYNRDKKIQLPILGRSGTRGDRSGSTESLLLRSNEVASTPKSLLFTNAIRKHYITTLRFAVRVSKWVVPHLLVAQNVEFRI
jgi:hypothetical protein